MVFTAWVTDKLFIICSSFNMVLHAVFTVQHPNSYFSTELLMLPHQISIALITIADEWFTIFNDIAFTTLLLTLLCLDLQTGIQIYSMKTSFRRHGVIWGLYPEKL